MKKTRKYSEQRRTAKRPTLIKEAIEETTKRLGLNKKIEENKALVVWSDVVGKKIAQKSKPLRIIRGTLYVKAKNPAWSHQLSFLSEELKKKLNKKLGKQTIKEIRFRS